MSTLRAGFRKEGEPSRWVPGRLSFRAVGHVTNRSTRIGTGSAEASVSVGQARAAAVDRVGAAFDE